MAYTFRNVFTFECLTIVQPLSIGSRESREVYYEHVTTLVDLNGGAIPAGAKFDRALVNRETGVLSFFWLQDGYRREVEIRL